MRVTKTMHVDAKPEQVLSFFLDSSISPSDITTETIYESPEMVGSSYEWTWKMFGLPRKGVTVLTDYVPGESVTFRNFGAFEGTSTWTVEPDNGGSKATVDVDAGVAIPVVGRFLDPLLLRQWEKNLAWGKQEIEKKAKAE